MASKNVFKRRRVELAQVTSWALIIYLFFYQRIEIAAPTELKGMLGLALVILGILVRALSAGYLSKNRALASSGLYALTRNPLYFGSFLMLVGVNIIIWNELFAAVTIALFALTYVPTILGEEKHLAKVFPDSWDAFKAQTPRFFPAFWRLRAYAEIEWSVAQWKKNREYNAILAFVALFLCWLWYSN